MRTKREILDRIMELKQASFPSDIRIRIQITTLEWVLQDKGSIADWEREIVEEPLE